MSPPSRIATFFPPICITEGGGGMGVEMTPNTQDLSENYKKCLLSDTISMQAGDLALAIKKRSRKLDRAFYPNIT